MYEYEGSVKKEFISEALKMLDVYMSQKEEVVERVKDNISIYRQEYATMHDKKKNKTVPKTGFILSAVENKQADFVDNYPAPNFLAREPEDEETAKKLSQVVPAVLELCDFRKTYKKHVRQKIKKGTGIYGVFYNDSREEIEICELDFMSVYCDMNVSDVQESRFLFIVKYIPNHILCELYPKARELFTGDSQEDGYSGGKETKTHYERSKIIDCYYKKNGKLHLMKFCGDSVIEASEDIADMQNGVYADGEFPVVFDVMYPDDDGPFGFGTIDIIKNPQEYIDRLDGVILKNCFMSGNPKKAVKMGAGVNINDLLDAEKEVIEVKSLDENTFKDIGADPLPAHVANHRAAKITELKEVAGNRDFQQGGTSNGVTSGTALTVLQEAGDKLSRSQIDDSYDAYKGMIKMTISRMREFYTEEKVYRITNEMGENEHIKFSGSELMRIAPEKDAMGFESRTKEKDIEFDISVVPQRQNVYKRETNNQTVTQLYQLGFFNPENAEMALMALKAMNFDGRDSIMASITEAKQVRDTAMAQARAEQMRLAQMQNGGNVM